MSKEIVDQVSTAIRKEFDKLSPIPSELCIFRVHDQLRKQNENAYEPTMVSIGPYHHGKNNLKEMEQHKLRYLQQLLERDELLGVDSYIVALIGLEERARKCYAEPISLDNKVDFVKMMLLDGCFIIELFRRIVFVDLREMYPNDPIVQLIPFRSVIKRDLMLFENQLPFFILDELFNMTKTLNPHDNINCVVLNSLCSRLPGPKVGVSDIILVNNANHLLGLVHKKWCSSFAEMVHKREIEEQMKFIKCTTELQEAGIKFKAVDKVNHLLGLVHKKWCSLFAEMVPKRETEEKMKFIKCTTELREAGIKFKAAEKSTSLFNIKFKKKNGIMEIPPFAIGDHTELVFRNLIAYEQYLPNCYQYVTDYVRFMDSLINSAKDVEKLRHCGIIENWLGDDEVVATMFNKLRNNITSCGKFCYLDDFNNVNEHCEQRWNTWMAKLNWNYFNSPWAIISVLGALVLLLLTLTQTIFSILSYV